ncbi:hypothetical protein HK097_004527 [Rhizophlyctis rosea]|uniref:Uncharacterized protein n=1 Tax=Rhizophlyctis rosea TaxID=64517 RepID=A0AAD5S1F5_9FUNG|nr:hypothetical protein HK097_004527 [Rhizophlyctis rosea]
MSPPIESPWGSPKMPPKTRWDDPANLVKAGPSNISFTLKRKRKRGRPHEPVDLGESPETSAPPVKHFRPSPPLSKQQRANQEAIYISDDEPEQTRATNITPAQPFHSEPTVHSVENPPVSRGTEGWDRGRRDSGDHGRRELSRTRHPEHKPDRFGSRNEEQTSAAHHREERYEDRSSQYQSDRSRPSDEDRRSRRDSNWDRRSSHNTEPEDFRPSRDCFDNRSRAASRTRHDSIESRHDTPEDRGRDRDWYKNSYRPDREASPNRPDRRGRSQNRGLPQAVDRHDPRAFSDGSGSPVNGRSNGRSQSRGPLLENRYGRRGEDVMSDRMSRAGSVAASVTGSVAMSHVGSVTAQRPEEVAPDGWEGPFRSKLKDGDENLGRLKVWNLRGRHAEIKLMAELELDDDPAFDTDRIVRLYENVRQQAEYYLVQPQNLSGWEYIQKAFVKDHLLRVKMNVQNIDLAFLAPAEIVSNQPPNIHLPPESLILVILLENAVHEGGDFTFRNRKDLEAERERRKRSAFLAAEPLPPLPEIFMCHRFEDTIAYHSMEQMSCFNHYDLYDRGKISDRHELYWFQVMPWGLKFRKLVLPEERVMFGWGGERLVEWGATRPPVLPPPHGRQGVHAATHSSSAPRDPRIKPRDGAHHALPSEKHH